MGKTWCKVFGSLQIISHPYFAFSNVCDIKKQEVSLDHFDFIVS